MSVPQDVLLQGIVVADETGVNWHKRSKQGDLNESGDYRMYAHVGQVLVPPERLLKASLLIVLYSVRSERAFCEEPGTTCPAAGSWTWT